MTTGLERIMIAIRRLAFAAVATTGLSLFLAAPALAYVNPDAIPDLEFCPQMAIGEIRNSLDEVVAIPCVAALQQDLQAAGFTWLDITGGYDAATWEDVWNFQYAHSDDGLEATGDADRSTIEVLDRIANSPAAMTGDNGADSDGVVEVSPPSIPDVPEFRVDSDSVDAQDEPPDDCSTSCELDYWVPVEVYE
jgi:hypothetical protein